MALSPGLRPGPERGVERENLGVVRVVGLAARNVRDVGLAAPLSTDVRVAQADVEAGHGLVGPVELDDGHFTGPMMTLPGYARLSESFGSSSRVPPVCPMTATPGPTLRTGNW